VTVETGSEKGFAFSLLCGHPDYYPKFGYRTRMFSVSGTKVKLASVEFNDAVYTERPVNSSDPFMIKMLDAKNADLINYCDQVAKGALKPGIVVFPPVFDVDDGRE
jgi:predicted N-acetyltransferase YhbS